VAGSAACGLKPSGALDVGVLVSERPCHSALVDTVSALPSAAVRHTRTRRLDSLRGVVVNAGNANAATGSPGLADAAAMTERVERAVGAPAGSIAVCSTGTIGDRLPLSRVERGIDDALATRAADGGAGFGAAICTTDRSPKGGAFTLEFGGRRIAIGAAAKGAGMINPHMATMLAYLTTDAAVTAQDLERITTEAAHVSFNRISVDGQMSPSDTLIVFANGEGPPLEGDDLAVFARAVASVCRWLAIQMVKDGEGADHAVRVLVDGALDAAEAERVARHVGGSPLVKAAIFGRDPNWGRVSQAVGQVLADAEGEVHEPVLTFDGLPPEADDIAQVMAREEYDLGVALGRGEGVAELWVSDLSYAYVELNAEYHT
jgi:glutamate N-acetyltransferase/amino-acid N-acetyltransferase